MHGLRSIPKSFVTSFAAIILILMTASLLAAQTPTVAVEKTTVEPNAVNATPTATTKEETPAVTTIKTESEPAKANAAAPPQVVPCPAGSRKIMADVVAIPQPIMLNRLGATIPNGFV